MNDEKSGNLAEELLEEKVAPLLRKLGLKLATAESCTGGLIGHHLTNIAGSSEYYMGGIISYDNYVKQQVLGVPVGVLETVGAVSEECAIAMAQGARRVLATDLGLSTTGIAGPGGATPGKPVGLVYIALADGEGYVRCEKFIWQADRISNKERSAQAALRLLFGYLQQKMA
ncbi:MAG: CinA family protein [Chloroflexi bacterium]|nr:CinA family protein [Chloroflexota bacterium]